MGHVDRHVAKSEAELLHRLFKEWKLGIGALYDGVKEDIMRRLSTMSLEEGRSVLFFDYPEFIGFGITRQYEKFYSKTVRCVVFKDGENVELVTAYPDADAGVFSGEKCSFDVDALNAVAVEKGFFYDADSVEWKLFLHYVEDSKYPVRFYIKKKNSQVRVCTGRFTFKVSPASLEVMENSIKLKSFEGPISFDFATRVIEKVTACPNILNFGVSLL